MKRHTAVVYIQLDGINVSSHREKKKTAPPPSSVRILKAAHISFYRLPLIGALYLLPLPTG